MTFNGFTRGFSKRRITFIYLFYWLMLAYIVAALVFWFISLNNQNVEITKLKRSELHPNETSYVQQINKIEKGRKEKTFQYVGEGMTFLILIIAGAVFVFRMLRRQLNLSAQQRDFMMAVTHELKTPIAITKLNLETILKRNLDSSQQKRLIYNTLTEADRLNVLCNNMLLLNDSGVRNAESNEEISLNELIEECVHEHQNRFPHREFVLHDEEAMQIIADKTLLKLAINNLLDNAVKYSPKDSLITVSLFVKDGRICIAIADEGIGISAEEVKKIFQKYYRGATEKAKGTGLGLYVTRRIIRQSSGKIGYEPNVPKGSIFTISFAV